jgi:hypothetical protein
MIPTIYIYIYFLVLNLYYIYIYVHVPCATSLELMHIGVQLIEIKRVSLPV